MKHRKSYQEQKEILKNKREALRQGKIQKLVGREKILSVKERIVKREFDRIVDSFKVLFVLILTPFMAPIVIIPVVLLFILSFIIVIKELLVGTFNLLKVVMLPFRKL